MKLIRKVSPIEVKKCFACSQLVRKLNNRKKGYLGLITKKEFADRLALAKMHVSKLTERDLDLLIFNDHHKKWKRVNAYNAAEWYIGEVGIDEVGVWKRAGELPLSWTNGTLAETADKAGHMLGANPELFTKRAAGVANMLRINVVGDLQREKYLLPIVFEGGTGTRGRKYLRRKMKGDIDDGNMRSIALTISGKKVIRAYIGMRK